jgi:hypothetical protein
VKKVTAYRHRTTIPIEWNAPFKKQLAAILKAKPSPTFGPENDEPGEAPPKYRSYPTFHIDQQEVQ